MKTQHIFAFGCICIPFRIRTNNCLLKVTNRNLLKMNSRNSIPKSLLKDSICNKLGAKSWETQW